MEPLKNVTFIKANIFEITTKEKIKEFFSDDLDIIVSDMAG